MARNERPPFQPPRQAPPPNHRALITVVQRYADYHGLPFGRAQRWLSYAVLSAVLNRCRTTAADARFILKGGAALELRLRDRARGTKDIDAIYRASCEQLLLDLDEAFVEPYQGFTLARAEAPEVMRHFTRLAVQLAYHGKRWSTIKLEVSFDPGRQLPTEQVPAIDLRDFGFTGPTIVSCLALETQVAQKLHAMTEPIALPRRNQRVRDLLDVWMLRDQVPPTASLRVQCEQTFAQRATHSWPPTISVSQHWIDEFPPLAQELSLTLSAADAARDVTAYLAAIVTRE